MRIQLLPKNTTQCPRPGLQPEPRNPELSTLTTRTLGTDFKATFKTLVKRQMNKTCIKELSYVLKSKASAYRRRTFAVPSFTEVK